MEGRGGGEGVGVGVGEEGMKTSLRVHTYHSCRRQEHQRNPSPYQITEERRGREGEGIINNK